MERREYIENLENKVKLFHCSKIPFFSSKRSRERKEESSPPGTSTSPCRLSIFLLPKQVGGPWLARVHSFRASPCTSPLRRRAYLYPSPASPFLITSEAEHKQQEAPHLLQRQFLLVINTRISMACCSGNCGCGAGCKCGTGCGGYESNRTSQHST